MHIYICMYVCIYVCMCGLRGRVLRKHGPLEKGMANYFSILALNTPWTAWKTKIYYTERWTPQVRGAQNATREELRNSSRRNEEAESKQKQCPVVDISSGESKVWWHKKQYCIGSWHAMSMNQREFSSFLFSSVVQFCQTLCGLVDCNMPGFPVHHHLLELTQTHHVHQVGDAIQPSHPLPSPSPPACNLSQHQGLF